MKSEEGGGGGESVSVSTPCRQSPPLLRHLPAEVKVEHIRQRHGFHHRPVVTSLRTNYTNHAQDRS